MLNNMAKNGVIGLVEKGGTRYFYTLPFVVGMFEGQVKKLTPEFLSDVEQYTTDKAFGHGRSGPLCSPAPYEGIAARHQDPKTIQAYLGRITGSEAIRWMDVLHGR